MNFGKITKMNDKVFIEGPHPQPESFLDLYQEIHDLGYVNMNMQYIYDTPENQFEFHVILQKKPSLM